MYCVLHGTYEQYMYVCTVCMHIRTYVYLVLSDLYTVVPLYR